MSAALITQRDHVINLKNETFANIRILIRLHPMPELLTRQIFKDKPLEKLTQNIFNHLAYYLVSLIDPQVSSALPWPVLHSKTARAYRNELSAFITDYGEKGLLTPVISCYLINPGCYKVTMLVFQLSQLAVQRVLESRMNNERQKKQYKDITTKYKSHAITSEDLQQTTDEVVQTVVSKHSNYLRKREVMKKMARIINENILQMEDLLIKSNAQGYINNLMDGYIKDCKPSEQMKEEVLKVKNIQEKPEIFEKYLLEVDKQVGNLESEWDRKVSPFLNTCREALKNTEILLTRHSGADKTSFTIEYNHKTDEINTSELQKHVNSEQKCVLKNIVQDQRLNFPNLIRGFLISISFIFMDMEIDDNIYDFNICLHEGHKQYSEIASSMKAVIERVMNVEKKLKPQRNISNQSVSIQELAEIAPLPDLTNLKFRRINPPTILPFNRSKLQFNLRKKMAENKPLSKPFLITAMHRHPWQDFLKSVTLRRVSAHDQMRVTQLKNIISTNVQKENKSNKTNPQWTTEQLIKKMLFKKLKPQKKKRLNNTKFKHTTKCPDVKIKYGNLLNVATSSTFNGSMCLTPSHSSPNLIESRENREKFSTIKEDSLTIRDVSGIVVLNQDSNQSMMQETCSLEISRKVSDFKSMSSIVGTSKTSLYDVNKEDYIINKEDIETEIPKSHSTELFEEPKPETPVSNVPLIKKTGSLEKIINRFQKIRASVLPEANVEIKDSERVDEEKENFNMANTELFNWFESDDDDNGRPRESLGTALGVNHNFLDEFDLVSD